VFRSFENVTDRAEWGNIDASSSIEELIEEDLLFQMEEALDIFIRVAKKLANILFC
jgi:undecaprenyl pyrophosphate synthase